MTGITMLAFELVGKRLEALKEVVPRVSRVAVLASPAHPGEQRELSESQRTARDVGVTLLYHQVNTTADVNAALDATIKDNANALLAFPDPVTSSHRGQIAEFATKHRLPTASTASVTRPSREDSLPSPARSSRVKITPRSPRAERLWPIWRASVLFPQSIVPEKNTSSGMGS